MAKKMKMELVKIMEVVSKDDRSLTFQWRTKSGVVKGEIVLYSDGLVEFTDDEGSDILILVEKHK